MQQALTVYPSCDQVHRLVICRSHAAWTVSGSELTASKLHGKCTRRLMHLEVRRLRTSDLTATASCWRLSCRHKQLCSPRKFLGDGSAASPYHPLDQTQPFNCTATWPLEPGATIMPFLPWTSLLAIHSRDVEAAQRRSSATCKGLVVPTTPSFLRNVVCPRSQPPPLPRYRLSV